MYGLMKLMDLLHECTISTHFSCQTQSALSPCDQFKYTFNLGYREYIGCLATKPEVYTMLSGCTGDLERSYPQAMRPNATERGKRRYCRYFNVLSQILQQSLFRKGS